MIFHGLLLNLFEINYWKVYLNKHRKIWNLECTKTLHRLAPSFGVPSLPLLKGKLMTY